MSRTVDVHKASRLGLTLVEMLVAIVIFTAIISSVILMFNSVTNTVRRSYRTMDLYEQMRSALFAVERDVQVTFAAPTVGVDFQFYGEPHGFVLVGIAPDQTLGRLTYVVHRDTSRMSQPGTFEERGERITLPRDWEKVAENFANPDELRVHYPNPQDSNPTDSTLVDFEVEVIYGLLLRFYESGISSTDQFLPLERLVQNPENSIPRMPRPAFAYNQDSNNAYLGAANRFPWLSSFIWDHFNTASVPWHVRDTIEQAEACHYWIQLLHGPSLSPIQPWSITNIWTNPWERIDQFWFDPYVPLGVYGNDGRRLLWDHVVADGFVLETYLLTPDTGERIQTSNNRFVPVVGPNPYLDYAGFNFEDYPNFDPIFRYAVENREDRVTKFNTLYNLNYRVQDTDALGNVVDEFNAFERLSGLIVDPVTGAFNANPGGDEFDKALSLMTETRQFYEMGNPLQARLPSSFDITLWVLNDSGMGSTSLDLYRFSQSIQLPAGFRRRSRAVN